MKEYQAQSIRNIAILGHLGSGKTSLTESLLYISKGIDKKGEVDKKTTVSDYLPEEHARLTTLTSSLIPVEWKNYKINFIDLPGSEEFVGEVENVLSVVKGAVLVIDASAGVQVGTERSWELLRTRNIPTLILVNKMDKENVKFEKVLEEIRTKLGRQTVPFCWPLGHDESFDGFARVIDRKASIFNGHECVEEEVYPDKMAKIDELYADITEVVAETSEEMLEKFFSGEELTLEEIKNGLRIGTLNGEVFPVLVSSALKNIGIPTLLDMIIDYMPSPADLKPIVGKNPKDNTEIVRRSSNEEPFSAYVFKTIIDPFVGTINIFKIYSGTLKTGQDVYIPNIDQTVKTTQIFTLRGKNQIPVEVLNAGDIGAITKMGELFTGATFCDRRNPIIYEAPELPTPTIYVAIQPKNKQDEDRISSSLQRLKVEDPTLETVRNPETAQLLLGGQGMTHISYVLDKMKNMFKVDVDIIDQKIVYRETIRATASAQGRHKKQSGGAGQFGDVHIRFEPTTEDFEFHEEIFGGAVPKNYFPAVEKGLIETLEQGPLAGFPVIGVKATLYDGSYHPVDSNEISFKLAAALAFKEAAKNLRPTILEPIMELTIIVKDEFIGDILGDINKRRGRVLGMNPHGFGSQEVKAEVPESEIIKYATDLKAMTQGSGRFTRKFLRYEEVPEFLIPKIVEEYKKK